MAVVLEGLSLMALLTNSYNLLWNVLCRPKTSSVDFSVVPHPDSVASVSTENQFLVYLRNL